MEQKDNKEELSLEEYKTIKKELVRGKNSAQEYIQNHFFYMKGSNAKIYKALVFSRVGIVIEDLYMTGIYDQEALKISLYRLQGTYNDYGDVRRLKNQLTYFYNEAIPNAYKNNIFSYKRAHPKAESFNENVQNYILMVAKEYRNHRMGLTDSPKGK